MPLTSGSTSERGRVLLAPAGSEQLKGKLEPVPVFIPALSTASVRDHEIEADRLVGRADALALLEAFVQSRILLPPASGEGPEVFVLEGGLGMGKSMLLNVMEHEIIPRCMKNKGIHMPVLTLRAFSGHSTFRLCHELLEALLMLHGVVMPNASFFSCLEVCVASADQFSLHCSRRWRDFELPRRSPLHRLLNDFLMPCARRRKVSARCSQATFLRF